MNELLGRKVAEPQVRENNYPKAETTGRNPRMLRETRAGARTQPPASCREGMRRCVSQIRKESEHQDHNAADCEKPGNQHE